MPVEKLLRLIGGVDDGGREGVYHRQEGLLGRVELVVHLLCQAAHQGFLLACYGPFELGLEIGENHQGKGGEKDDHHGRYDHGQFGLQGELKGRFAGVLGGHDISRDLRLCLRDVWRPGYRRMPHFITLPYVTRFTTCHTP